MTAIDQTAIDQTAIDQTAIDQTAIDQTAIDHRLDHRLGATTPASATSVSRRRLGRAGIVAGAVVVTTACFLAARAAGADFTITDPGEGKIPHTFVAAEIAMVTAIFGLLGWATLALLERWTHRARRIWIALAGSVTLLSLMPIWIERATTQTRLGLALVHLAVGACLLPLPFLRRVPWN